jgi:hypothetical protein
LHQIVHREISGKLIFGEDFQSLFGVFCGQHSWGLAAKDTVYLVYPEIYISLCGLHCFEIVICFESGEGAAGFDLGSIRAGSRTVQIDAQFIAALPTQAFIDPGAEPECAFSTAFFTAVFGA